MGGIAAYRGGAAYAAPTSRGISFTPGGYSNFQADTGASVGANAGSANGQGQHAGYQLGGRANSMYVYGPEDEMGNPTMVYSPQDTAASQPAANSGSTPMQGLAAAMASIPAAGGTAMPAPGGGGAKVVDPGTDSGAAVSAAATGGGAGYEPGGPGDQLSGPSQFRQGIGTRSLPNPNSALAGLHRAY